jgi:tetratricopeptide (TPR) repeat protein
LARALELKKDDALTIAFQAALAFVAGDRLPDLKGRHDELFKKARELEPDNVGVLSLAAAVYSGNTEKAIEITERIRKLLGPEFKNWSRHGQERILFTQGRAYARAGRVEEARACFEDGLRVNPTAFQAELDKLKK